MKLSTFWKFLMFRMLTWWMWISMVQIGVCWPNHQTKELMPIVFSWLNIGGNVEFRFGGVGILTSLLYIVFIFGIYGGTGDNIYKYMTLELIEKIFKFGDTLFECQCQTSYQWKALHVLIAEYWLTFYQSKIFLSKVSIDPFLWW